MLKLCALVLSLAGCVSTRVLDVEGDRLFREGRFTEAAARFEAGALKEGGGELGQGRDGLLYLMDLGLAHHSAGHFAESNRALARAEEIAEIKDYTSLGTEAASLLIGENTKAYQGEDFEKTLITLLMAMNYGALGDLENARVASRRANSRLYRLRHEGGRNYPESAFAHYLIGQLALAEGEPDNAAISFRKAMELEPSLEGMIPGVLEKRSRTGELLIIFENGIAPIKRPSYAWRELPMFVPRPNPNRGARVWIDGVDRGSTVLAMNIEEWAIRTLDEKYAPLVAKRIAGVVAKEAVADAIGRSTKSELVGALARIGFYLADQADLRSWQLLPHDLQIWRARLPAGAVSVELRGDSGQIIEGRARVTDIRAGRLGTLCFRYIP